MKVIYSALIFLFALLSVSAQRPVIAEKFDRKLSRMLSGSVPFIYVQELEKIQDHVILLDARELEEYHVSHLNGAIHIGYDRFDKSSMADIPLDADLVVYCSIGYRSEKIGQKLQKMGYRSVRNLYGSIFEWVNQGKTIVDSNAKPTPQVHCYNKKWSRWMTNPEYIKVY